MLISGTQRHNDKKTCHRQEVFVKKEKISYPGAGRLREERERIGFSQLDAETLFGISRVTWGKYERGDTTPGADVLTALAAAGADVLYILTGTRNAAAQPISPRQRALLDNYEHSDESGKAIIEGAANLAAQSAYLKKKA